MKKIKITEEQLKRLVINEQLLKNLGDKIKTGAQNVVDKVKTGIQNISNKPVDQNKETTIGPQNKGRNLDQLRAEWTKINQDVNNKTGFGEAVGQTESSARTQSHAKARVQILKKLGKQQATFGSDIVDEAMFQLENGNYVSLVLIKMREDQINEQVSRIKSIMNINEEEEQIPDDVMMSIEAEADKIIANSQKEREELLDLIKKVEIAIEKNKHDETVVTALNNILNTNKQKLDSFYTQDDKPRLVNSLIVNYKHGEAFRKYGEERAERAKTATITREQIIDVFVTALEGGSNYWYYILDIPKQITYMVKEEGIAFSEACGKYVLDGGELAIYDIEETGDLEVDDETGEFNQYDENKPEPLGYVNMDSLLDAISIMKRDYPDRYEAIIMDEYDAEDADVFFQIATMGEIVFG